MKSGLNRCWDTNFEDDFKYGAEYEISMLYSFQKPYNLVLRDILPTGHALEN